jgi:site-specific DNA-cytosine methylase
MISAGYTSLGGVEYHKPAADIYNLNHQVPVTLANILDIDRIPTVDLLWASPICKSFSIANTQRGEKDLDIEIANHVAKLIADSLPRSIAIENVKGYANSQSLAIILDRLKSCGYNITQSIECAANYGTPTTRERLIVRASQSRIKPMIHSHQKRSDQIGLFDLPGWVSWWDVVKDRIHELPPSRLTENQQQAISNKLSIPLLVDGNQNCYGASVTTRAVQEPANTITATIDKHPIRLLVDTCFMSKNGPIHRIIEQPAHTITAHSGQSGKPRERVLIERVGYYNGTPNTYQAEIPAPTIRSAPSIDDKGAYRVSHNIADDYDCYAADIKCLAAWQGFPPDYNWGENRGEAGRGIGNAVPPPLAKSVAESFY